ncbi:L-carnitine dehydrogenase [Frankliniella fusca]|uniref:L-carnitine dehydrogenase n=1 Tax=Frankliniella fusca TaxID=407009 RepID=A0AAE1LH32_9NEOP|nr:L-carnitine dehydrogenase [Frankliniella fusca]
MPRPKRILLCTTSDSDGEGDSDAPVGIDDPLHPAIEEHFQYPNDPNFHVLTEEFHGVPTLPEKIQQDQLQNEISTQPTQSEEIKIPTSCLEPVSHTSNAGIHLFDISGAKHSEFEGDESCPMNSPLLSHTEEVIYQNLEDNEMLCGSTSDLNYEGPPQMSYCDKEEEISSNYSDNGSTFYDASSDIEDFDNFCGSMPSGTEPLHSNSDVSIQMALVALLTLVMTHRLTKECLADLLALLKLLLPKDNILLHSSYLFFSYFDKFQSPFVKHFYCRGCSLSVASADAICPQCGPGKGTDFFIHFLIADQIQKLLKRPGFFDSLKYSQTRIKTNQMAYEDIYDGSVYKEASRQFFSLGNWISLMWNTDGFSIFKSSLFSVWPFYLSINELPPNLRLKKENMLLGGLWFGTGKFDPNLFLKPIYGELCKLREGFLVHVSSCIDPIKLQVGVLCGTCDVPAKSCFFHHIAFNGLYGCLKCLSRGLKSAASGNVFVYPFEEQLSLRSEEVYLRQIEDTRHSNGQPVFGVRGPSYLQKMVLMSPIASTAIDIMHCVFLGCQKTLLHLLFDKTYQDREFSLHTCTNIVNDYLNSIKPPHFLQRCPQSLKKLAFWKASEYESFFFFYSLPIFSVIMDSVFFNHFVLLYESLCLLCQESVLETDIVLAQTLIDKFVERYQVLYGLRHMTHNLHLLRHLPNVVRELGPLWTSTCYLFEDLNGTLKHSVHGTQYVGLQVQANFGLATNLSNIIKSGPAGLLQDLCLKMYSPTRRLNISYCISEFTSVVGPVLTELNLEPIIQQTISSTINRTVHYFKRLRFHSCLYVIESDSTGRKSSSYVVYSGRNNLQFGILQAFLRVTQCQCSEQCDCPAEYFAAIKRLNTEIAFETLAPVAVVKSVVKCSVSDLVDIVNICTLKDVCVNVNFNDTCYLIRRSYRLNLQ